MQSRESRHIYICPLYVLRISHLISLLVETLDYCRLACLETGVCQRRHFTSVLLNLAENAERSEGASRTRRRRRLTTLFLSCSTGIVEFRVAYIVPFLLVRTRYFSCVPCSFVFEVSEYNYSRIVMCLIMNVPTHRTRLCGP